MSLRLLVDECIQDRLLIARLREASHDVRTVSEAGLIRKPDSIIFDGAIAEDRMVITINCADFIALHESKLSKKAAHPGILLVYRYNVPKKEMSLDDIIKAIANLEQLNIPLRNQYHSLNIYKY